MQLGKKTNTRLYDELSSEIASVEDITITPLVTPSPASIAQGTSSSTTPTSSESIQISFTETMSAKTNRDGGLEALEVQGQLNLYITDTAMSRLQLRLNYDDSDGTSKIIVDTTDEVVDARVTPADGNEIFFVDFMRKGAPATT